MPRSYGTTNAVRYASAPAVGAAGDTYYNTTNSTLYVSNGTAWVALSGGAGAAEVNVSTGGPTTRVSELLWVDTDAALAAPVTTGWQTLVLTSPWANYGGGGWAPASIRRLGDIVELRGLVTNNGAVAPSTIAAVPAPTAGNLIFLGAGDSTSTTAGTTWAVDIRVYTDGRMQIQSPISSFLSLSQVRYSVA